MPQEALAVGEMELKAWLRDGSDREAGKCELEGFVA